MNPELLLVSDLDDTLLGDRAALQRFEEYVSSVRPPMALVYASGRFFESIRRDVASTPLPTPLAVIGGVGSEIRSYPDGDLNQAWVDRISSNWSAETVRKALANEEGLELQPEESQFARPAIPYSSFQTRFRRS